MSEPGARSPLGPRCASEAGGDPGSGPGRDARTVGARDRIARYAGLVGALLLAVAGYLGGALPDADTAPDGGPLTVTLWLLGTIAMVGAWWALRAGAPSTRWAYVTAGWWALPLLVTAPLGSRDVYSYACQGWIYADGGDPYAIGVAAAGCPWAEAVAPVWRDTPACLPGLARAAGVPPRRATWLLLACPLVGVHLVAGAHNDAVMLGLLLPALLILVHRPGRLGSRHSVGVLLLAGVLLGLAVSVKATAVVVLPFAALAAVRGRPGVRTLLRDGGLLALGAVGGLLVLSWLTGLGLGWLGGLGRSGDTVQWTSPPTAIGMLVDYVANCSPATPTRSP